MFFVRLPAAQRLAAAALLGAALVPAIAGGAWAQTSDAAPIDPAAVVATVNGVDITEADLSIAASDLSNVLRQVPPGQQREYVISFLIDVHLVARKAEEEGLDADANYKRQIAFAQNKGLVQLKLEAIGSAAVTDEAIEARYEEAIKDFKPEEEVRARHILVKTEDEAKSIKAEIDGGATFEDMAAKHSTDGSSQQGGDLGYFTKGMMVPPFAEAAFAMEPDAVSDPVQTQFGWHLIKVEDKRTSSPPALEDVRAEVSREVAQVARRDYVTGLREEAEIVRANQPADAEKEDEEKTE